MSSKNTAPRRALRTVEAAGYIGVSPSLLRKMRLRGTDDPLDSGPPYIRLSPSLIVYDIVSLDAWMDRHAQSGQQESRVA